MFIVESYIFIGTTEPQQSDTKQIIIWNYFQIWLFPFFWSYSLFPNIINENCELYFRT